MSTVHQLVGSASSPPVDDRGKGGADRRASRARRERGRSGVACLPTPPSVEQWYGGMSRGDVASWSGPPVQVDANVSPAEHGQMTRGPRRRDRGRPRHRRARRAGGAEQLVRDPSAKSLLPPRLSGGHHDKVGGSAGACLTSGLRWSRLPSFELTYWMMCRTDGAAAFGSGSPVVSTVTIAPHAGTRGRERGESGRLPRHGTHPNAMRRERDWDEPSVWRPAA